MRVIEADHQWLEAFRKLQSASSEVYASDAWCSAYLSGLKRFLILNENEIPVGGFVLYERRKWGLKILITPPFASHCGLFFETDRQSVQAVLSFRKKIAEAVSVFLAASGAAYFKVEFPPEFTDFQPFIWRKQQVDVRYTYILDISGDVTQLESQFDPKLRNKLAKASKEGYEISRNVDVESAYRLFTSALKRNGAGWDESVVRRLMSIPVMHHIHVLRQNVSVATALFAGQGRKCYYLFGAADRSEGTAAGPLALFSAIRHAAEQGFVCFDFEGSMIPEVEAYFRQFGGRQAPMYSVKGGRGLWPRLIRYYLQR